jgi:hypothetical protein
VVQGLPASLNAEVLASIYGDDLLQCDTFGQLFQTYPGFLDSLILAMQNSAAVPGDCLMAAGEESTHVHFLLYGTTGLYSVDAGFQTCIEAVSFFGEAAALEGERGRHEHTVLAESFCELLLVSNVDFMRILRYYPHAKMELEVTAKKRIMENVYLDAEKRLYIQGGPESPE